MKHITIFVLRGPKGIVSRHSTASQIGQPEEARAKALKSAQHQKERWEASEQFRGERLSITEE